jgi:hypothetical protein
MALSMSTFGPFFKVTCSPVDVASASEADLVGVLEVWRFALAAATPRR